MYRRELISNVAMIMWHVWKGRNNAVLNDVKPAIEEVVLSLRISIEEYWHLKSIIKCLYQ